MRSLSVVIAEDDASVCDIQSRFIARIEGFELIGVGQTFAESEELIDIFKPNLVLLDMDFPDGDGIELLRKIRQQYLDTDVICITAAKDAATLQQAIRGGVFAYVLKPMTFKRFEETLTRYLEHRRKLSESESLDQAGVDRIVFSASSDAAGERLPKGIDAITLKTVQSCIQQLAEDNVSAEELGKKLGMSRTTARRYLEYLVAKGAVEPSLEYGSVGRPERRYFRT